MTLIYCENKKKEKKRKRKTAFLKLLLVKMCRKINHGVPNPADPSTSKLSHLKLREHHKGAGRETVRTRGPGLLV